MNKELKDFLETYESKLQYIRKLYLKDLYNNNGKDNDFILILIFGLLSVIFSIIILIILEFSTIGYIISLLTLIILCSIYGFFEAKLMNYKSRYLYALKKRGYKDIEDYEEELRRLLTGPEGYYQTLLEELKLENKIDDKTKKITTIFDEEYYIWMDNDILMLLSTNTDYRPEVKSYDLKNIRYYRVDLNNNYIVLNTSTDQYNFYVESLPTLKAMLPKKDFKNAKNYKPEDYINDYELYVRDFKKNIEDKNDNYREYLINSLILVVGFSIMFIILGILNNTLEKFNLFIKLVSLINMALLFDRIRKLVRYRCLLYTVDDVIYEINRDRDILYHFYELKVALKINENYDVIISNNGYPYDVWVSNDYFHLFLDVPHYNVIYVVLGLKNDIKYRVKKGETILKLKDKTFRFNKDASIVFDKLLNDDKNK